MNLQFLKHSALLVAVFLISKAGVSLALRIFGVVDPTLSNLIFNVIFMLASLGCIPLLGLSAENLGLKIIPKRLTLHIGLVLAIFAITWLYYLFGVRISGLRPFTSGTVLGLLNYLVVAFAEEIYFRGLWYHTIEERFSGRAAVFISGLLFGLAHYNQGLGMLPKFFTGWLWGSVRYATGMMVLLIPLHFNYNSVWLLFEGSWNNTPWVNFFPFVELLGAILVVARSKFIGHPESKIVKTLE